MQIVIGGVYWVRDDLITLVPREDRELHDRRTVVVVSGPSTNSDTGWPFLLVCPVSSSTSRRTRFCAKLAAGEANVSKKCWIRVPALQPMEKEHLQDHTGVLSEERLQEVQARLVEYLGLLDEEEEGADADPPPERDDNVPV